MKKPVIIILVVIAVIGIIAGFFVGTYNGLVEQQTAIEGKQAEIQTQLQRRADLIPNFVNTVKGYSDYEQSTLQGVTDARAAVSKANTPGEQAQANAQLDSAIDIWVNAVTEAYPDLKANQQYIALQDELAGTENRIANARRQYNEAVQSYNTSIRKFPKSLLAGMFGFEKAEFFEADADSQDVPKVEF
ncbi:MAG: LemA family protein [Clostridia bacterium]|nr:LemA family protein [Clostridia bacterium]